jgi:hypothetical protein
MPTIYRDDLSDRLIHLTKGEPEQAMGTLLTIIDERRLIGGIGYIKGRTPLRLLQRITNFQNWFSSCSAAGRGEVQAVWHHVQEDMNLQEGWPARVLPIRT